MGVDGFWPIVSSKGKRVTLDILADKVIAIDASIWIYQFANALRDSTGEPIRSSHIVGFFKRICKLLYLRIKPVFVFDGPPIPLKFAALRKRRDDSVPDSMFRKAARQILLSNLRSMQADPQNLTQTKPILSASVEDDDSPVDEIYVVTDSSDEDAMSPSRRLRLTVPEAFRGFVAERRTLDSVSLPISPERPYSRNDERKEVDVDAKIDLDALKDLPLHEQYRGLLETRTALLSQGRRKALNLASKLGATTSQKTDLDQLSQDQIKAVVDLARVTDLSKAIRLEMSRNEGKDEIYIPAPHNPPSSTAEFQTLRNKKKRRKGNDQFYLEGDFSDKHSVLSTARTITRGELLFDKSSHQPDVIKNDNPDILKEERSEEDDEMEDKEKLISSLFGDEWSDLLAKRKEPVSEITQKSEAKRNEPMSEIAPKSEEKRDPAIIRGEVNPKAKSSDIVAHLEHHEVPVIPQMRQVLSDVLPESPNFQRVEASGPISCESSEESVEVDSESGSEEVPTLLESARPEANAFPRQNEDMIASPEPDDSPAQRETRVEVQSSDILTDAELTIFAELADPFPFFANDLEEEIFDNRVREKINVVDSLDNTYEEIQELLTAFGIPWVCAPADAEAQCAFLASAGLTDGVISDDSDTLMYGSPVVFRHLYIGESTVEIYRLRDIGFSQEALLSLALLLGCDFTVGVRGIGPVNATEIVRFYSGMEGLRRLREWAERFASDSGKETDPVNGEDPEDAELREFKRTHANYRAQWLFPEDFPSQEVWDVFDQPLVDTNLEAFSWAVPDQQLISQAVTSMTSMRQDEVDHILRSTMSQYMQATVQRRITDYFSPAFERGSVAEVVSKRLQQALERQTNF
jgi:5'-3' exonuclease